MNDSCTTGIVKSLEEAELYIEELREENIKKTILIELLKKHCNKPIDWITKRANVEYEKYISSLYNGM